MTVSAYLFSVVKGRQVYGVFSNFTSASALAKSVGGQVTVAPVYTGAV